MELSRFEEVGEALRGLVASDLGELRYRAYRYSIKVWFDTAKPTREHYEAQVIGPEHVDKATTLALEVGFHSEHPRVEDNEAVIAHLLGCEDLWRPMIGDEAVAGPFLGHQDHWRRVSETWPDPDLDVEDIGFELAARLTDYMTALEPLRRDAGVRTRGG